MSSLSLHLPITYNSADGFTMIKSVKRMIKQNFKMLLLTSPGERVMEPNFGVGVKNYLFSMYSENVPAQLRSKIMEQVNIYLPVVSITSIDFRTTNPDTSTLGLVITYRIPEIGARDLIELTI
jgi:phage baseplate assembly protein W